MGVRMNEMPSVRHGVAVREAHKGASVGAQNVSHTPPSKLPLFAISQNLAERAETAVDSGRSPLGIER